MRKVGCGRPATRHTALRARTPIPCEPGAELVVPQLGQFEGEFAVGAIEEVIDATLDSNGQLRLSHQPRLPPGPVRVTIRAAAARAAARLGGRDPRDRGRSACPRLPWAVGRRPAPKTMRAWTRTPSGTGNWTPRVARPRWGGRECYHRTQLANFPDTPSIYCRKGTPPHARFAAGLVDQLAEPLEIGCAAGPARIGHPLGDVTLGEIVVRLAEGRQRLEGIVERVTRRRCRARSAWTPRAR